MTETSQDSRRVELHQVTKRYGRRVVLRDVDLTLPPGRLVTVEGANGSGKSTLLRVVAGVAPPTSGTVSVPPVRVGYLPEVFDPPRLMRVDTYLRQVGRISGLSERSARVRAVAMVELLAIRPGPRHRLGALSKGNLQKVGLAQVFLASPGLIVLDEPRTALETSAWPLLDRLMADHVQQGALVVCSEHDPEVLASATDRVRVLDGSVVRSSATSSETLVAAQFRIRCHARAGSNPAGLGADLPVAVVEHEEEGVVSLRVPEQEKDPTLRWLLAHGWSITLVEPDERA